MFVRKNIPIPTRFGRSLRTRWRSGIGLLFLALAAGYQLLSAFQPLGFLQQNVLVMDDAYYYFQVARNFSSLKWVTFDGIHPTSGIQLLWGFILSALALFIQGRLEFLRAVLILSITLNVFAGLMLWRLGRRLHSIQVANVATLLWSGFLVGLWPTMMGMEYSLHVVIILAIIGAWWRVRVNKISHDPWPFFLLGGLLALNFWVRLDSAVFSLMVWGAVVIVELRSGAGGGFSMRRIAFLTALPLLGVLGYVYASFSLAGTFMPISGMAKSHYAVQHFNGYGWLTSLVGHTLWWLSIQSRPIIDLISSVFLDRPLLDPLTLAVVLTAILLTLWTAYRILRQSGQDRPQFELARFLGLIWLFGALHVGLVVATIGHFSHVTQHYYAWLMITWLLWGALLFHHLVSSIQPELVRRIVLSVAVLGFGALHSWVALSRFRQEIPPNINNRRSQIATWINQNLPGEARIGAWNAGVLGYFSDRPVVNLDGLANDLEYLRHLQNGASIHDYLRKEGITYLVDVNFRDLTMPYGAAWDRSRLFRNLFLWSELETVFVEPDQVHPVYVLRLRDEVGSR